MEKEWWSLKGGMRVGEIFFSKFKKEKAENLYFLNFKSTLLITRKLRF